MRAIRGWGWAIQYASESLRNDKWVFLKINKIFGQAIQYMSNELKQNQRFVFYVMKRNEHILNSIFLIYGENRTFVSRALEKGFRIHSLRNPFEKDRAFIFRFHEDFFRSLIV